MCRPRYKKLFESDDRDKSLDENSSAFDSSVNNENSNIDTSTFTDNESDHDDSTSMIVPKYVCQDCSATFTKKRNYDRHRAHRCNQGNDETFCIIITIEASVQLPTVHY